MGFRSCLANVNQYLLAADGLNGSDRWALSQLSGKLRSSLVPGEASSTADSAPRPDGAQRLQPSTAAPENQKTAETRPIIKHHQEDLSSEGKQTRLVPAPTQNGREKTSTDDKFHSASLCRSEVTSTQHSVWRPW